MRPPTYIIRHAFIPQSFTVATDQSDGCLLLILSCSVIVTTAGSWLPLVCLLGFTFSFTLGLGPVPWVLVGELYPASTRSLAAGTSTCCCYIAIALANWN